LLDGGPGRLWRMGGVVGWGSGSSMVNGRGCWMGVRVVCGEWEGFDAAFTKLLPPLVMVIFEMLFISPFAASTVNCYEIVRFAEPT